MMSFLGGRQVTCLNLDGRPKEKQNNKNRGNFLCTGKKFSHFYSLDANRVKFFAKRNVKIVGIWCCWK